MSLSNKAMVKKLEAMSPQLKSAYLASGRVTIGKYETVEDRRIKTLYVAKIRGVIVAKEDGQFTHETPEAARQYGQEVLAQWQKEFMTSSVA